MNNYSEKLKDPRWQRKRLEILERDGFACCDCGATEKTLHIHHCHYEKGEPWETRDPLLLTLCENCHQLRGEIESVAKLMLGQIMARLPNEPEMQDDLLNFVDCLREAALDPDFYPLLIHQDNFEWDSDTKWFRYACEHPEARVFYEAVTGRHPGINWDKIWAMADRSA